MYSFLLTCKECDPDTLKSTENFRAFCSGYCNPYVNDVRVDGSNAYIDILSEMEFSPDIIFGLAKEYFTPRQICGIFINRNAELGSSVRYFTFPDYIGSIV